MHEPTYRQAMREAWRLAWHNKLLWILGLLSVLVGQFGINNFIGQLAIDDSPAMKVTVGVIAPFFYGWNTVWSLWLLLILVVLGAALIFVTVAAQGALIGATTAWYTQKKLDLTTAWHRGVRHFWRLLGLNLIEKVILAALFLSLSFILGYLQIESNTSHMVLMILTLLAALFVAFLVTTVSVYAAGYIVVEERSLLTSFRMGWALLHDHLLVSLELNLLLLLSLIGVAMIVLMVGVWVLIPTVLMTIAAGLTGVVSLVAVGVVLTNIAFILFVVLLGAVYNTFTTAAWMYLFMKMHHEGVASRFLRWFKR